MLNSKNREVVMARKTMFFCALIVFLFPAMVPAAFLDNGDQTLTDTSTGLIWRKASHADANWAGAIASCEALMFPATDGNTDWRLPSRSELQSIVDYTKSNPSVDTSFFSGIEASDADNFFWTSTTYVKASDPPEAKAWAVNFADGTIDGVAKSESHKVLAVRGGQNQHADLKQVLIEEPAQSSRWMKGRVMPIIWVKDNIKTNVTISISPDAGKTYIPIVENLSNSGSYVWWKIGKNDKGEDMGLPLDGETYTYMLKIKPYVAPTPENPDPEDGDGTNVQGLFTMGPDTGGANFIDCDGDEEVSIADIIRALQVLAGK